MVAFAAHAAATNDRASFDAALLHLPSEASELCGLVEKARQSAERGETTDSFARSIGVGAKGVSGYVYQTVPAALHAAWRFPYDLRAALHAAYLCGGDTDTVGAIVGGIVGAGRGPSQSTAGFGDGLVGMAPVHSVA